MGWTSSSLIMNGSVVIVLVSTRVCPGIWYQKMHNKNLFLRLPVEIITKYLHGFLVKKLNARTSSNPAIWSLCGYCENTTASAFFTEPQHLVTKSGVVSITTLVSSVSINTLLLRRLSLGLVDVQTGQSQPIIGTPLLVPVPKCYFSEKDKTQLKL